MAVWRIESCEMYAHLILLTQMKYKEIEMKKIV